MKLSEVMVAINPKLSDVQAEVLFRTFMAGNDPQAGAEAMKGNNYFLSAGEQLIQQKMLQMQNGGVVIATAGVNALRGAGYIDQNNQPTQLAQKFSNSPDQNTPAKPKQPQQQQTPGTDQINQVNQTNQANQSEANSN